jgi:hypothetical protein
MPPILRFSPQTILPDTPDQLYCDISVQNGRIVLPYLDNKRGPIYNGKQVIIVLQLPLVVGPNQLEIEVWNQYGGLAPGGITLVAPGATVSVTAFWDESAMVGQWLLNQLV